MLKYRGRIILSGGRLLLRFIQAAAFPELVNSVFQNLAPNLPYRCVKTAAGISGLPGAYICFVGLHSFNISISV